MRQVQERSDPVTAEKITLSRPPARQTVLVVEDDPSVRESAARFLDTAGFRVITAKDGVEALQLASELGSSIGALLTDVVLPRMRGTELASRLSNFVPDVKVIFMSGYLEHIDQDQKLRPDALFLEKPFTRETLLRKVNEAFGSAELAHRRR
jgi:two-component system, cell cycle sensor histidine kinase and response regulator CckA